MAQKKPLGKMIVIRANGETKVIDVPITERALFARVKAELHDAQIAGMFMLRDLWLGFDADGKSKKLPQNKRVRCVVGDAVIVKLIGERLVALTDEEATTVIASMDEANRRGKRNKELAVLLLEMLSDRRDVPELNKKLSPRRAKVWAARMVKENLSTPEQLAESGINEEDAAEVVLLLTDLIIESNKNL
jgi:hypothetical protein